MPRIKFAPIVNWNRLQDPLDLEVWTKLTNNFWLDTKVPLASDIPSWATLPETWKETTKKVFTGLTMLDTIQGTVGAVALIPDSLTQHEEAVYTYIAGQESIHAKSYSSIFSTLCSTKEIDEVFEWAEQSSLLQNKAAAILGWYDQKYVAGVSGVQEEVKMMVALRRKAASTLLESFLFYSGFYWPLYMSSRGKLTNTADIIRLIIRDEAIHGFYIGHKFRKTFEKLSPYSRQVLEAWVYEFLMELYDAEVDYSRELYAELGLVEDVEKFLRYNANKALMNMGFQPLFPADTTKADAAVMSSLSPNSGENFDFFSGSGSSYVIGVAEATQDDDWSF